MSALYLNTNLQLLPDFELTVTLLLRTLLQSQKSFLGFVTFVDVKPVFLVCTWPPITLFCHASCVNVTPWKTYISLSLPVQKS